MHIYTSEHTTADAISSGKSADTNANTNNATIIAIGNVALYDWLDIF